MKQGMSALSAREAPLPRKTLLPGVIYFDERKQSIQCTVRELSAEGATLSCEGMPAVLTKFVELYIPNWGKLYPAAIKERHANELLVAFVQETSIPDTSSSDSDTNLHQRVQLLEIEMRKLRNLLNELKVKQVRGYDQGI